MLNYDQLELSIFLTHFLSLLFCVAWKDKISHFLVISVLDMNHFCLLSALCEIQKTEMRQTSSYFHCWLFPAATNEVEKCLFCFVFVFCHRIPCLVTNLGVEELTVVVHQLVSPGFLSVNVLLRRVCLNLNFLWHPLDF